MGNFVTNRLYLYTHSKVISLKSVHRAEDNSEKNIIEKIYCVLFKRLLVNLNIA